MKKIQCLIWSLITTSLVSGQARDTIKLSLNRPVKCGYTFAPVDSKSSYVDPINGIMIYSPSSGCDSVFSLSWGKVRRLQKIDNYYVCVIENRNIIYTYSLLASTVLKAGTIIKQGGYLGQMSDVSNSDSKELFLQIKERNKVLSFDKQLSKLNER